MSKFCFDRAQKPRLRREARRPLRAAARLLQGSVYVLVIVFVASLAHGKEGQDWPLFRGDSQSSGVATGTLPDNLEFLWKFKVKDGAFEGTPAIASGVVYIGDLDGSVYALGLEDGQQRWKYETESGFIGSPAYRNERIYIGDYDGVFYCLKASNGELAWKQEIGGQIDSSANFYQGNVLVGSQNATLFCLNAANGEVVWQHMIDDQIRCTPTIAGDRVFLAGCDGHLHVLELAGGKTIAKISIGAPTGVTPAVHGDFVYFGTEGGEFLCVNWKEAQKVWTYESKRGSQPYRSSAAATADQVVVGSRNKRVLSLDPRTGDSTWSFAAKHRIDSSPVIVGQRVYVGSADGRIYGLELKTGAKVWEYETGGGFTGSAAIADGRLVIASDDGVVYCFGAGNK